MSPERVIVIDTKFVPEVFKEHRGKLSVRSSHLYQLFAYLRNIHTQMGGARPLDGVLLYPSSGADVDLDFSLHGHRVKVCTLDLNLHWRQIEAFLLRLVASLARAV